MACLKQRIKALIKWRRKWHRDCSNYMGDEKVMLYASGGGSPYHPGSGVVLPWSLRPATTTR
eukprot:3202589-Lingulodinium_polyedra.AAC.1